TLSALTPQVSLLAGTSASIALPVRLLTSGTGQSGHTITYSITSGTGSLGSTSATTDANGAATVNLSVSSFVSSVSVNACTSGAACTRFAIVPMAAGALVLQTISGDAQMIAVGQSFQPIVLRVTDTSSPQIPMANIPVIISGAVFATTQPDCAPDTGICRPAMPHALANFN